MKVDSKFNKRSATQVNCNYTQVSCKFYGESSEAVFIKFLGTIESGDLSMHMNVIEAHRLLGQINEALSLHAKVALSKAEETKP
jgi:hypothetical protein